MMATIYGWLAHLLPRRLVLACLYRCICHTRAHNECRVGLSTITAAMLITEWREVVAGEEREARA